MNFDDVLRYKYVALLRELARRGNEGAGRSLAEKTEQVSEIETSRERFRRKHKDEKGRWDAPHWSGLTVDSLCRDLDLLGQYAAVYKYYSETIHVAARSLAKQLTVLDPEADTGIRLVWGPTADGMENAVCYGCGYAMRIALLCASALDIPDESLRRFRTLAERHAGLFVPIIEDLGAADTWGVPTDS